MARIKAECVACGMYKARVKVQEWWRFFTRK